MPDPAADARRPLPEGAAERTLADGTTDRLVREEPLLIVAEGQQLLTMRTPGDDRALVVGFLLSEGAVPSVEAITDYAFHAAPADGERTDEAHVRVRDDLRTQVVGRLTRTHEVRSSCGICGLADPGRILEDTPALLPGVPKVSLALLHELRERFVARQTLFAETGACHGAAVYGADGSLRGSGEDVGRHNALDKALGHAALDGQDLAKAIVLLSGRAGYDLVVKCLRLRVPVIASVSAASTLSLDLCAAAGATLVGFLRPGRAVVYCDGARLGPTKDRDR